MKYSDQVRSWTWIIASCSLYLEFREHEEIELNIKNKSCGKYHYITSPLTIFCQNPNPMNGKNARTQNLDEVLLRKTTPSLTATMHFFIFIYITVVNLFSRYNKNNRDTYIVHFFSWNWICKLTSNYVNIILKPKSETRGFRL